MQQWRIPRPAESPRSWVSAGVLVAVLVGIAAGSSHSATAPAPAPAVAIAQQRLVAVDIVAPQPIDVSFAQPVRPTKPTILATAPAPALASAAKTAPVPTRVRADRTRTVAVAAAAPADTSCSGDGWQQRRGDQALAALLHPVPAGVTVAFLPGRGALKGMTYYDTHHVEVYVNSCADETDALLRHVVAHEMGHAWDSAHMTEQLRADYLAARGIAAGTPWFGCNGCRDFATPAGDFAETYAQWQRGATDSRTEISHPASAAELSSLGARFFS